MRFSWSRFGSLFAADIRKYPVSREPSSDRRWQLDVVFERINGRETQKVDLPCPERERQLWAVCDHDYPEQTDGLHQLRIPEHAPTHSDNIRPLVPGYSPTSDALP
jgi:hypothetical protein